MEFEAFPKVPRLSREIVITEKIDGTNASVWIGPVPGDSFEEYRLYVEQSLGGVWTQETDLGESVVMMLRAGSRTRWITPEDDNHGFARWVKEHAEELKQLGPGHHFGEWWGSGIQRGYGLPKGEKRFSLFNVGRWMSVEEAQLASDPEAAVRHRQVAPACCHTVPILYRGPFSTTAVGAYVAELRDHGSWAAPGYKFPEGVVVWHEAARQLFKKTCHKDEDPKSAHVPGFKPAHPGQTKAQAGFVKSDPVHVVCDQGHYGFTV